MVDEIFSNFYIIIPIAIVIALRILEARNKAKARDQAERRDAAPSPRKPDRGGEFSPFGGSGGSLPHWALRDDDDDEDEKAPVPLPPQRSLLEEMQPEVQEAETPALVSTDPVAGPAGSPAPCFPANLEYLPPLKRALALTEILGTPKGLM